jgi:hypothetical protein
LELRILLCCLDFFKHRSLNCIGPQHRTQAKVQAFQIKSGQLECFAREFGTR